MILMDINGVRAVIRKQDVLTAGMVGQQVEFRFDESWDKMGKTAVFRAGDVTKDVTVTNSIAKVPHEVLIPGVAVEIGVYGSKDDGAIVIPTVWAKTNIVEFGADPSGDESVDPTLPIWGQIQEEVEQIHEEVEQIKENGVGGITEEQFADMFYQSSDNGSIDAVREGYLNDRLADYVTSESLDQEVSYLVDTKIEFEKPALIEEVTEKVLESIEIPECGAVIDDENISTDKTWSSKKIDGLVGDISSALDELHNYAQGLINGGGA